MDREDMPDLWVIDGEQKLPLIEFYKRQKMMKTRWVMPMSSTDLFIGLPDDVICHILSFLPTKYSARTSLLAKRWRFLWSRVPCLEFKCRRRKLCDDFVHPNIIDRVLSHHEANISSFRLSYTYFIGYDTETEFELWMDIIIARDIPNLTLSLRDVDLKFMMPRCLFTSQTLLDLSLTQCGEIPVGITVHFPALKRLQLDGVEYESDESLPHLLSGCPVLEELTVHATTKPYHWCISLPTLTSLVLKLEKKEFRVKLDTPALSYLQLRVSEPENIFFGTLVLDSLIEADVAHAYCPGESIEDNLLYADSVKNIFGMLLYNTKFLTLNETNGMKDPKYWLSNDMGVKFRNLTKLDVRIADLSLILSLLGNANQLRVLNISEVADHLRVVNDIYEVEHTYIRLAQYVEPKQVPSCLISHLQEVNMHYVTFPPIKVMIARYILINAKVLKMMKMRICTSDKIKLVALTTLEKGSPACELAFAFEIDPFDHDHEDWSKFSHHKTYI